MSNPFYAILADLLQREAFRLGYSLMILCSQDEPEIEASVTEMALSRQADGVVILPSSDPSPAMDTLRSSGIPYVVLSRKTSGNQDDCILCDEEQGGYLAGKHLIGHGHRRLAMFSQNPVLYSAEMRRAGFERACREEGIPESDCLFVCGRTEEDIIAELKRLKAEKVTGLFSFCDVEAWEEITLMDRIGMRDSFGIVGFDNILGYVNFPKPICSIDCSLQETARLAVDLLRKRIHDRTLPPQQVVLPVSLICRDSCGPA
jgi:LacI family transcriptional regulator